MPHSIEAEQQLLGAILTNNDVFDRVASIIGPDHFYDPVHARIYEIASARIAKNNLASPVTLKAFMEEDEGLQGTGRSGLSDPSGGLCDQLLRGARLRPDDL